jgi:hypothetical protein
MRPSSFQEISRGGRPKGGGQSPPCRPTPAIRARPRDGARPHRASGATAVVAQPEGRATPRARPQRRAAKNSLRSAAASASPMPP